VILPDVNLLLYAEIDAHRLHALARRCWEAALSGERQVGLAPVCLFGFLRLGTSRRVFTEPLDVEDAIGRVEGWRHGLTSRPSSRGAHIWRWRSVCSGGSAREPASRPTCRSRRTQSRSTARCTRTTAISRGSKAFAGSIRCASQRPQRRSVARLRALRIAEGAERRHGGCAARHHGRPRPHLAFPESVFGVDVAPVDDAGPTGRPPAVGAPAISAARVTRPATASRRTACRCRRRRSPCPWPSCRS
jgi:hypothetical protein